MPSKRLITVFEFDLKANRFIAYYEEFPNAVATGVNKIEAENNLVNLVKDVATYRYRISDIGK